jgi:hypothetical protein
VSVARKRLTLRGQLQAVRRTGGLAKVEIPVNVGSCFDRRAALDCAGGPATVAPRHRRDRSSGGRAGHLDQVGAFGVDTYRPQRANLLAQVFPQAYCPRTAAYRVLKQEGKVPAGRVCRSTASSPRRPRPGRVRDRRHPPGDLQRLTSGTGRAAAVPPARNTAWTSSCGSRWTRADRADHCQQHLPEWRLPRQLHRRRPRRAGGAARHSARRQPRRQHRSGRPTWRGGSSSTTPPCPPAGGLYAQRLRGYERRHHRQVRRTGPTNSAGQKR